jgi:polyisoprenoid-binding protein YceI
MTAALLALLVATQPAGKALSVDPAASAVRFHVVHKLHKVDGGSKAIEGKAVIGDDGKVLAMVRIPIASFDSGDANRDANMRETLEASRYPYVVFKGTTGLLMPVAYGKATPATLEGELEFHGVRQPLQVPVTVEFGDDGSARVRGSLTISLDAFHVERPSLLFVKLDDACRIDVDLALRGAR